MPKASLGSGAQSVAEIPGNASIITARVLGSKTFSAMNATHCRPLSALITSPHAEGRELSCDDLSTAQTLGRSLEHYLLVDLPLRPGVLQDEPLPIPFGGQQMVSVDAVILRPGTCACAVGGNLVVEVAPASVFTHPDSAEPPAMSCPQRMSAPGFGLVLKVMIGQACHGPQFIQTRPWSAALPTACS